MTSNPVPFSFLQIPKPVCCTLTLSSVSSMINVKHDLNAFCDSKETLPRPMSAFIRHCCCKHVAFQSDCSLTLKTLTPSEDKGSFYDAAFACGT